MANNAEAARARRKLRAAGAKKLGPITVADLATWTEILHEENVLPFSREGRELTANQLRDATERLIGEWCQERRREKAELMLQQCAKIRERERLNASRPRTRRNRQPSSQPASLRGAIGRIVLARRRMEAGRSPRTRLKTFWRTARTWRKAEVGQENGIRIISD
jgi:hypothetical protein